MGLSLGSRDPLSIERKETQSVGRVQRSGVDNGGLIY